MNSQKLKNASLGLLAFSLLAGAVACRSPNQAKGLQVVGQITGLDSGTVILKRSNLEDRTQTTLDSVTISGGKFELNTHLEGPEQLSIVATPGNWSLAFFAENGQIQLEADTSGAKHFDYSQYGGDKGAVITRFTVVGSKTHDAFLTYEKNPDYLRYQKELDALNQRFEQGDADEKARVRMEMDSLRPLYAAWEKHWIDSFVTDNPESVVGAYLFNQYSSFHQDMKFEEFEAIVNKFAGEARKSPYFKVLDQVLQRRVALQPGKLAPDFTALTPDSTEFKLSSTRGKLVLLDFWASWCIPCRHSIPHWKEVYAQYHEKGFEIVGISNDSQWAMWTTALEEEQMPWIQVIDDFPKKNMPARLSTEFEVPFLPTYILLDQEGKILKHNGSKEEITALIKEKLGE